jgi:hypothetical protein
MAPEDFKRKLTAIFSADAVGYSRLMGEDESATVKTLASYNDSSTLRGLCLAYLFLGQCREAIDNCRNSIRGRPNNLLGHIALAATFAMCDRPEDAPAMAAAVIRIAPKFSLEKFSNKLNYKNQADKIRFVEALRKAGLK